MLLKYVVDSQSMTIIEVPLNYKECRHCGKWSDPSDFIKEGGSLRANCVTCYNMSMSDFLAAGDRFKSTFASKEYSGLACRASDMNDPLYNNIAMKEEAIPLSELILALQKLPKDALLYIKSETNDREFGSIMLPEEEDYTEFDGKYYYQIGEYYVDNHCY